MSHRIAKGPYMEVQDSKFVDGPIALGQVPQHAMWLLAAQNIDKAQRMASHWPWQMS